MNISEFAKKVGVSKSTVSNFLNNKTGKMSEKTRKEIEAAIEQYEYIPNLGARHLCNHTVSNTIGIVMEKTTLDSMFHTAFFSHIHQGISDVFKQYGYRALIIPEQEDDTSGSCLDFIKGLSRGLVDGFLLFNIQENDDYISIFEKQHIPFMCFGQIDRMKIGKYVGSEHSKGIDLALDHFFSVGKTKIAISVGSGSSIVAAQLRKGYVDFHLCRGVPVNEQYIILGKKDYSESVYQECKKLLQSDNPPEGFILSRFQLDGLLEAVKETNKVLFKDTFFILTNYFPVTEESNKYSYVRAPVYELGKAAAEKLIAQINGENITPQMFPMQFIHGESCGCGGVR